MKSGIHIKVKLLIGINKSLIKQFQCSSMHDSSVTNTLLNIRHEVFKIETRTPIQYKDVILPV